VIVPADLSSPGASFAGAGALLARRDVLSVLLVTLSYFVAIFIVFSYIGPVLQALVPMPRGQQALTLALFGLAGVAGTLARGWANDRFGPRRTLAAGLLCMGAAMALLPATAGSWAALVAVLWLWGVFGFALMAPQQSRLAALAPPQAPLLLSLNASMLYLGTALGAIVGGAVTARLGLAQLALAGLPFVAIALALLAFGPHSPAAPAVGARPAKEPAP
jgi:MFS transporter, DHA1 family, inner membrane transport protein